MKKSILLNSLSGGAFFFVNMIVAFKISPILLHTLGNDAYGAWEILLSVQSYLILLDLGIIPAIVRFVARAAAQDDRVQLNRILTTTLFFLTLVGLAGFLVMGVVAAFPDRVLNLHSAHIDGVRVAAILLGVNLLIQFPAQVFVSFLMGMQRHYFLNALRVVLAITQAVLIYSAFSPTHPWPGASLVWLALFTAGSTFLESLGELIWLKFRETSIAIGRRHFSLTTMKELNTFGLKSMALMFASRIQNESIPIVIGWVLSAGQVPYFAIPNRLIQYTLGFSWALGFPLSSHFSHLDGKGDLAAMREAWFTTTRFLQFVLFGATVAVLAMGEPFLLRWMGPSTDPALPSIAEGGKWVIRLVGASLLVEGLAPNASRLLVAMNRHGFVARLFLTIALISFPITVALAHFFGIPGVAISVLLARLVGAGCLFVLSLRAIETSIFSHLRHTVLRFVLPVAGLAGTFVALHIWRRPTDYPMILGQSLLAAVVYVGLVFCVTLLPEERRRLLGLARDTLARLRPDGRPSEGGSA